MQRFLTTLFLVPLALAAVFLLPARWFLLFVLLFVDLTALELIRIGRGQAPGAPLRALLVLIPLTIIALAAALRGEPNLPIDGALLVSVLLLPAAGLLLLFGRTPVAESLTGLGVLTFGTLYLAVPGAVIAELQRSDPWLVVLLIVVVAANDTLAFWIGSRFGRRKLSPRVSPGKSWEGAVAGFLGGVIAAAAWAFFVRGEVTPGWIVLGAAMAVMGQCGDLLESMLKRGAGVKDSGRLLPGHGGLLDRIDALLLAAPTLWAGMRILEP